MVMRVLLVLYIVAVLPVAFWPTPIDQAFRGGLLQIAAVVRQNGLIWLQYEHIEFAANVLMFVPLGLLLTLELRSSSLRNWFPPVTAIAVSILIETVQFVVLPERFTTALDVLANTSGGVLGWLVALPFARVPLRSAPERVAEEEHLTPVA